MLNTQFAPWPSYSDEEVDAASKVLKSNRVNYWTGSECREFEKEFARWCDTRKAVSLANGTLAIDCCLASLGIGRGDEVIVTPRTFLASASAIANAGAVPVFADVDRDSQNITPATVEPMITAKTKAILCVHLAGWPCEMDQLSTLAAAHSAYTIEDCAQAHGATYRNRPVGSLGDIAAWSFCQDKIMTTGGEGGMVTMNDQDLWNRAWSLKDHGKDWKAVHNNGHPSGFRWLHHSFGHNWRMTEIQAAIGRLQIRYMPEWHRTRTENANRILNTTKQFSLFRSPSTPDYVEHAWYKCYVFVDLHAMKSGWDRDRIIQEILKHGVPCFSGSCSEVYLEKAFDNSGLRPVKRLPVAKELGETSLMFLVHPTLTQIEIEKTCDTIAKVATAATR